MLSLSRITHRAKIPTSWNDRFGVVSYQSMTDELITRLTELRAEEAKLRAGGGNKAITRQHEKNRLTARERLTRLVDGNTFFELGLWAAWNMYQEWGGAPSAGVVTGIGRVAGRQVMLIANDAT